MIILVCLNSIRRFSKLDNTDKILIICQDSHTRVFQLSTYGDNFCWHRWTTDPDVLGNTPIESEKWYHVAVTFNSTHHALFVNGILNDQKMGNIDFDQNVPINIGRVDWNDFYFRGRIDEVIIFERALLPAEILNYYVEITGLKTTTSSSQFIFDSSIAIRFLLFLVILISLFLLIKKNK